MNVPSVLRDDALAMFQAGIDAVGGRSATARACRTLTVRGPVRMLALGKAADAMASGALEVLGAQVVDGLVITKHGHLTDALRADERLRCLESSHPVPDADSLVAGEAMLAWLGTVSDDQHLLVLVSGGGSSLVEALQPGTDLPGLRARTDALLADGTSIGRINEVRRSLSRIKGGRALDALGRCAVTQLLISDVPGDVLVDIASGPFIDDGRRPVDTHLIASNALARRAVADAALSLGYTVDGRDGSLDGDVEQVAERLERTVARYGDGAAGADPRVHILGGEPTLQLPPSPGRGGRNQHLAARLAPSVSHGDSLAVLVCGTDGTDGPTDAAGGFVEGDTMRRAAAAGLDLQASLDGADSGRWLEAAGALIRTGPTGTNVMDLAIVLSR